MTALRVLFVCEGNVCRSPAAQILLASALPGVVRASSAGLTARVGEPVAEGTARLLRGRGLDPGGHHARSLTDAMLAEADLVVTMTRAQRSSVVSRVPSALRRTWTLLDLSGTLGSTGLSLTAAPDVLLAARTDRGGDVPDPWGRGGGAHRRAFGVVADAVETITAAVPRAAV